MRRFARSVVALADPVLRRDFVVERCLVTPPAELGRALDALALAAEQGDERAKDALVAVVDAMNDPRARDAFQRLREEAAGAGLVTLNRLLRHPARPSRPPGRSSARPPDYSAWRGRASDAGEVRPLTLGERKSLAKRPDRNLLERLLGDPHPDVIRGVLQNPRLTEDDVVRFVARATQRPEHLAEVARSPAWSHRPRVRLSLVLAPRTPVEVAIPLAGLLLRHELRLVVESTAVAPPVRAACVEHLRRKYPHEGDDAPVQ